MASLRFLATLFLVTMILTAVTEGVVLCPSFPACCYVRRRDGRRTCHLLCPPCDQADEFTFGIRNRFLAVQRIEENEKRFLKRKLPEVTFITGEPFTYPEVDIFRDPLFIF
ncbi:uncharacterized protein [Palaemon carinicauda]|uniref:uncharacterized protein n=1 Tax=Palaemon carinicauda TaxID=392227 RepID=UPI0035B5AD4D